MVVLKIPLSENWRDVEQKILPFVGTQPVVESQIVLRAPLATDYEEPHLLRYELVLDYIESIPKSRITLSPD